MTQRITLGAYIKNVNLHIADLTDDVIELSDLVDYADGEESISECYADDIPSRVCATRILRANGMGELLDRP